MKNLLDQIRDRVMRHAGNDRSEAAIPGISLTVAFKSSPPEMTMSAAGVCLVLRGSKQLAIGDEILRYDAGRAFVSAVDMPATRCMFVASSSEPYVATGVAFSPERIAELLADISVLPNLDTVTSFGIADASHDLLEAWDRYLALLDVPQDILALAPVRERELLYRLLRDPHGCLLQQMARDAGALAPIRRAIEWMKVHFDKPLPTRSLADIAGMSVPAFNRRFRAATHTSPLQYQKALRLQAARLMLEHDRDAAGTAYAVGYSSASQFSRDYARYFGCPPKRDAIAMRESLRAHPN